MLHAHLSAYHKLAASSGGCESEYKAAKLARMVSRKINVCILISWFHIHTYKCK